MRIPMGTITSTLALLLGLGVAAAAQGSILLQGGAGQPVTFTGQGAGTDTVGVTLGACDSSGVCTLSGTGAGSGSAAITSSGTFAMTSSADSTILTPAPAYDSPGLFGGSTTAPGCYPPGSCPVINFVYTGSSNGQTGTLLAGKLDLLNFYQAPGSNQGSFNYFPYYPSATPASLQAPGVNTLLGGVFFAGQDGGALQLNLQFATSESVSALLGTDQSLDGFLIPSTLAPTPEPSTLALMGAGLLLLGVCARLRGRTQITV